MEYLEEVAVGVANDLANKKILLTREKSFRLSEGTRVQPSCLYTAKDLFHEIISNWLVFSVPAVGATNCSFLNGHLRPTPKASQFPKTKFQNVRPYSREKNAHR